MVTTSPRACRWWRSMLANNETGVIQPLGAIAAAREGGRRRAGGRCRAGRRAHSARYCSRLRGFPDSFLAQDRRASRRRAPCCCRRPDDAEAAGQWRRPGKGPSRRHRKWRRPSPVSARPPGPRVPDWPMSRRCAPAATRIEALMLSLAPDAEIFGRSVDTACQHDVFHPSRSQGRNRADRLRSRRRRPFGRFGLFVGQGRAKPCAEGDGPRRTAARCACRSGGRPATRTSSSFGKALAAIAARRENGDACRLRPLREERAVGPG